MFWGIAVLGTLGVVIRYLITQSFVTPPALLGALIALNGLGSYMAGQIFAHMPSERSYWAIPLLVGLCGGMTTFSGFALEGLKLLQKGQYLWAVSFVVLNNMMALGCCYLGWKIKVL